MGNFLFAIIFIYAHVFRNINVVKQDLGVFCFRISDAIWAELVQWKRITLETLTVASKRRNFHRLWNSKSQHSTMRIMSWRTQRPSTAKEKFSSTEVLWFISENLSMLIEHLAKI